MPSGGEVSEPSTSESSLGNVSWHFAVEQECPNINYLDGRLGWVEPWMLDPADAYPFVEWSDLSGRERAWVISKRIAWLVEQIANKPLDSIAVRDLADGLERIGTTTRDEYQAMKQASALLRSCLLITDERAKVAARGPVPARKGHLMGEGGVLARVKRMLEDGTAMERKVIFNEPVNAYTMLNGDRIAKGGEMLTAMTTRDTVEIEMQDHSGKTVKRYKSRAVSI